MNLEVPDDQWTALLQTRASSPEAVEAAYAARRQPPRLLSERPEVFLAAADHPARGSLRVGDNGLAMADRRQLLGRLVAALAHPQVDGVLGSPDVIEELLLLGALEGKVVIGSMNRGGLDGASWTIDDRFTGYDAAAIERYGLQGGKMLLRIDDEDPATARTLESCGRAVGDLAGRALLALVEPLPYRRDEQGRLQLRKDTASLARAVTVAAALGSTSGRTWLKLPACAEPDKVFGATTLPCVLLGGVPAPDLSQDLADWRDGLRQPNVRGLVVGRAVLYPPDGDVKAAVDAAGSLLLTGSS